MAATAFCRPAEELVSLPPARDGPISRKTSCTTLSRTCSSWRSSACATALRTNSSTRFSDISTLQTSSRPWLCSIIGRRVPCPAGHQSHLIEPARRKSTHTMGSVWSYYLTIVVHYDYE